MTKKMTKKEKAELKRWRKQSVQGLSQHPAVNKKMAKKITKAIEETIEESFEKDKLNKFTGSRFETLRREKKKGFVK